MCGSPAQRKRLHALYEYITEEKLELEWRSEVLTLCLRRRSAICTHGDVSDRVCTLYLGAFLTLAT